MPLVVAIYQFIVGILIWVTLKLFAQYEIHGLENLNELKGAYIVVANHESDIDPPLVGYALFHRLTLLPFYYMAIDYLFYVPILNVLVWLGGGFRTHRGKGIDHSLRIPKKILEQGSGVIMFPEGHLVKERPRLGEGKRGAAVLALTTKTVILPMSIHTPANMTLWKFLFGRPHIVTRIGEPFYLNNTDYPDLSDENTYAATKVIMQKIADLYYQHEY